MNKVIEDFNGEGDGDGEGMGDGDGRGSGNGSCYGKGYGGGYGGGYGDGCGNVNGCGYGGDGDGICYSPTEEAKILSGKLISKAIRFILET